MPTIHSLGEAVLVTFAAILMMIPAIVGAIVLLIIGWFLADILARLVATVLRRIGFETVAMRTGVTGFISMTGAHDTSATSVIAELVKWFVRLIFVEMAAEVLHISAISNLINSIVFFIPNLIVALIVVMVGVLIANFVANIVRGGAGEMGFQNPNLLAGAARIAIIVFAVLIALNQVGIAATLVNSLFIGFVAAIALAAGLAFGLGGREVAGQMWEGWYQTSRKAAGKMEKMAAAGAAPEPAAGGTDMTASPPPPPAPYQVRHDRTAG